MEIKKIFKVNSGGQYMYIAYSPALHIPDYSQYIGYRPEDTAHPSQMRKTAPATNVPGIRDYTHLDPYF